jgi:hypothetical protein
LLIQIFLDLADLLIAGQLNAVDRATVQSVSEVTQRGDAQGPGGRSSDGIYQG